MNAKVIIILIVIGIVIAIIAHSLISALDKDKTINGNGVIPPSPPKDLCSDHSGRTAEINGIPITFGQYHSTYRGYCIYYVKEWNLYQAVCFIQPFSDCSIFQRLTLDNIKNYIDQCTNIGAGCQ